MKRSIICFSLIGGLSLADYAFGWPSGWPVTNDVPKTYQWNIYTTNLNLRTVVALSLLRSPTDLRLQRPDDLLLSYAKENGIPVSNMVAEARILTEEGLAMLSSGSITNKEEMTELTRYCRKLITFMSRTRDPSAIPYLEAKSASTTYDIRITASRGLINILGTESVPFLRKAEQDGFREKSEFYLLYKTLGGRLKAEIKEGAERDRSSAYEFLLGLADKEEASDTAKMLDQILCETLDGYAVSIQREQTAERMIRNGPDHSRPHFEGIKSEIERTPREKRIDVRQRLKKAPAEQ